MKKLYLVKLTMLPRMLNAHALVREFACNAVDLGEQSIVLTLADNTLLQFENADVQSVQLQSV